MFETSLLSHKCWPHDVKLVENLINYTLNLFGEQKVLYDNVHSCQQKSIGL